MSFRILVPLLLAIILGYVVRSDFELPVRKCIDIEGKEVDCGSRSWAIEDGIKAYLDECNRSKSSNAGYLAVTCRFFPVIEYNKTYNIPCEEYNKVMGLDEDATQCTHGFIIRATRQRRGGGSNGLVFITLKFFGLIQPVPALMTMEEALETGAPQKCQGSGDVEIIEDKITRDPKRYDVAEWVALGLSLDKEMGDDVVLHCNPFMDKNALECGKNGAINGSYYPDNIGIAVNKYFSVTTGKQAYEAERKFNLARGIIKDGKVTYTPSATSTSYGMLECEARISTFILIQSKSEISTGIEMDIEKLIRTYILIATGPCLQRDCLGDVEENELHDVAKRTTVMAKHRQIYITQDKEILFDIVSHKGGAGSTFQNYDLSILSIYWLVWMLPRMK